MTSAGIGRDCGSTSIVALAKMISDATAMACAGIIANHAGDARAKTLVAAAERIYVSVLEQICHLPEREADAIEPSFTELEGILSRINAGPASVDVTRSSRSDGN